MPSVFKSNLGKRILLLVAISTLMVVTGLTISGWLAVHQSSEQVFREREVLTRSMATYLDYILKQNLASLDNVRSSVSVEINKNNLEQEERALHSIWVVSILDGVFVMDTAGNVLWTDPRNDLLDSNIGGLPFIRQTMTDKRPAISDVTSLGSNLGTTVLMVSPLRNNEGLIVGLVGGWIDISGRKLQAVSQLVQPGSASHTDIVDSNGIVLASSDPLRVLKSGTELNQAGGEVVRSASLTAAPWSVVIGQPSSEALAPSRTMALQFVIIGLVAVTIALFLGWGMARSLVRPIGQLSESVKAISSGDLSQPVPQLGDDEIGQLGKSFDAMRIELKKSVDEIQQWNRTLEAKVAERTRQLEESYREIERKEADRGRLLKQVLTAQEEERKRIARELHDETTQSLVGLVMRLETLLSLPDVTAADKNVLTEVKNLAVRTIDNVHKIIFDLRPSVLDDLGLVSAIRWLAENRLSAHDVKVRVEVTGEEQKLAPQIEIALFRIVQEAITNIARHAEANNVVLSIEFMPSSFKIEIEDDGKGFDPGGMSPRAGEIQGVGLLGIKERILLIGGKFKIASQPSGGTHITVEVGTG